MKASSPVIRTVAGGTVTAISRWTFNCYVIHDAGAGRPLVIDPGIPSNGLDAADAIARLGGAPPVVLCTHGHVDHVAGVEALCGRTGVGYYLPAACESFLAAEAVPLPPGLSQVAKIACVMASQPFDVRAVLELGKVGRRAGHTPKGMTMPIPPAGFVGDDDHLDGTDGWEVLATPGHAQDATCLYHRASKTLVGGDTVLTHQGQAWISPEVVEPDRQAEAEDRLRSLRVDHLLPGHGLPISGTDLLANARSFRQQPTGSSLSERVSRRFGAW